MKLRELGLTQGTSVEVNLTHPAFVCSVSLPSGVGTCGESRVGGINVTAIKSPTINPANDQNNDIIIYDAVIFLIRLLAVSAT
jgi:hypothetical protein